MPTHVKRNSLLAVWALASFAGLAQAAPPAGGAPAPAGNTPPPQPSNNATEIDSSTSTALDYLFNHQAKEGTAAKATSDVANVLADRIKAVDMLKTPGLDDPEIRARFETYISLKEVPQPRIDEYFNKMTTISATLKAGDPFTAWKMLYELSTYRDLDAGISRELAARVESYWNTDRTKNKMEIANNKYRDDAQKAIHNGDLDARDLAEQQQAQADKASKGGKNSSSGSTGNNSTNSTTQIGPNVDPVAAEAQLEPMISSQLQGKLEMTGEYLNLLEARAKIKLNEIRANKMSDAGREDFSDYIRTLYKGHRYYHVILAADFYRALFNEGDYPQDLSNQVVAGAASNGQQGAAGLNQMSKTLGVNANGVMNVANKMSGAMSGDALGQGSAAEAPLSIADEVTSALEINHRVGQAIEVFRYRADKGEIAAAAIQLQNAFIGNEFHPGLQGLPRDEKEKVGDYLAKLDVLKNQLEMRVFEQVEGQIASIKTVASDFDPTKPMALVNDIKLEARLRLGKARLMAQAGQLNDAMTEFQKAAEEWPGNPDLNTSANTFFKTENSQNQATDDFDRLEKDQNYRGIFDRQLEFALGVKGDAAREQQLKDALTKVTKAKMAEEKANMLVMNGDINGAWETVETATKDWPDDTKLNKLLADLSGRSADFVSAVNKAREAEAKKQLGYSLNWYVKAQSYYPPSTIANDGIERVSKQVLSPQGGVGESGGSSSAN